MGDGLVAVVERRDAGVAHLADDGGLVGGLHRAGRIAPGDAERRVALLEGGGRLVPGRVGVARLRERPQARHVVQTRDALLAVDDQVALVVEDPPAVGPAVVEPFEDRRDVPLAGHRHAGEVLRQGGPGQLAPGLAGEELGRVPVLLPGLGDGQVVAVLRLEGRLLIRVLEQVLPVEHHHHGAVRGHAVRLVAPHRRRLPQGRDDRGRVEAGAE